MAEGKHASPSPRRKPLAIAIAAAVVVLVAGVVFTLVTGKNPITVLTSPKPTTPPFAFKVSKKSGALPTAAVSSTKPSGKDPELKLRGSAKEASQAAITSVTALYTEGFLDPGNWESGSYDNVWDGFDSGAGNQAQNKDAAILTAGTAAGDTFSTILPSVSKVRTKVLLDQKGAPVSVDAIVTFRATATTKTGPKNVRFVSVGQFFFQKVDGDWKIVSYQVHRADVRVPKPTPTPSGSATPSAGSS